MDKVVTITATGLSSIIEQAQGKSLQVYVKEF